MQSSQQVALVDRGSPYHTSLVRVPRSSNTTVSERRSHQSVPREETSDSRAEKIIGAIGGAALAIGGKELWNRRDGDMHHPHSGSAMSTAALSAAGAFAGYKAGERYAHNTDKTRRRFESPHRGYRDRSLMALESRGRTQSLPRKDTLALQHAAKAALLAGATEAFRVRKEPGGWGGPKGRRVLTAAIASGTIDSRAENKSHGHAKRHALKAIVGGLAANRAVNGKRSNVEREYRRSRSRERGLSDGESYYSDDSFDSRSPSPRRYGRSKRSKSVSDYTRRGMAAIGAR